jgi:hypothetical protein
VYPNNPRDLEALKQNVLEEVYKIEQYELQQVSLNLSKRIQACLTADGRHFNILYDGEYNVNYYIWLIINERSK